MRLAERLLEAFSAADFDVMRAALDPDLVAYIVDAEGERCTTSRLAKSAASWSTV